MKIPVFICYDKNLEKYRDHVFGSISLSSNTRFIRHDIFSERAMFTRFDLADKFPDYDRIIYLDNDVLLQGNIADMYSDMTNDYLVAAVADPFYDTVKQTIRFQNGLAVSKAYDLNFKTFLSGQLVINAKKWREEKIGEKCQDICNKYKCLDMIAMNIVCKDRIKELDKMWSAPAAYLDANGICTVGKHKGVDFSDAHLFHAHGKRKWWNDKNVYGYARYLMSGGVR